LKEVKNTKWGRKIYSINATVITGYPHAEEWNYLLSCTKPIKKWIKP
jgi:hypothetical protein